MTQEEVLKKLKVHYSEKFSHFCRDNFPTLLEKPDYFYNLIISSFEPSSFLFEDLEEQNKFADFKEFIYSKANVELKAAINTGKPPSVLLKEAGYTLYPCYSEKEIQLFKKYYTSDEELCTFWNNRLDRCYVFFAVKDNADKLVREDFDEPKRQDAYGTSVISIQFSKDSSNTLSIKNRYNHTVNNPDATFSNNLDNIIPGLTTSFNNYYHFKTKNKFDDFEMDNYVQANDGKFYRYNYERNNIYYCPDNIIIDHFEVKRYDKERFILMDLFLLELSKEYKDLSSVDFYLHDCLPDVIGEIERVDIKVDKEKKTKIITINDNDEIVLNKYSQIISYKNLNVEEIGDDFLRYSKALSHLELPNMKKIGQNAMRYNEALRELYLPNVEEIGNGFLANNKVLKSISLPKVKIIKNVFLENNESLKQIDLPKVEEIGDFFLTKNQLIEKINFPKARKIGKVFMRYNLIINQLDLPKVQIIGSTFLLHNDELKSINLPKVITIGPDFLYDNEFIESVSMPKLSNVGHDFLRNNKSLKSIYFPSLKVAYDDFIRENVILENVELPKIKNIGERFLANNRSLKKLFLPEVKNIGELFMQHNNSLEELDLPNIYSVGDYFLPQNDNLTKLNMPSITYFGKGFLHDNEKLAKKIYDDIDERMKKEKEQVEDLKIFG